MRRIAVALAICGATVTATGSAAGTRGQFGALIAFLRGEAPVPVWLVGTTMGSVSC